MKHLRDFCESARASTRLLLFMAASFLGVHTVCADTCARAKIEIDQSLAFERQALAGVLGTRLRQPGLPY